MKRNTRALIVALSAAFNTTAFAAVSADEAKKLGGPQLTEWGAERAGNKEGSIPAYNAATAQPPRPAGYDVNKDPGRRIDPYNEKPLFTITAQNASQYADKLDGLIELFKKYPDFKMNVYPTHRSANYPKFVLENTLKNATACKSTNGDLVLEGCYGGFPFPIPTNGSQLMWNHLLTFEAVYMRSKTRSWTVPPTGNPVFAGENWGRSYVPYYDPEVPGPRPSNLIYWKYRSVDQQPARIVGQQLILWDPLDAINVGRRAWQYIPGQRRVKLAPDLAYDTPSPYSGGSQNMDDAKNFLGAIDHFDWKLLGKKEKFIVYNNFNLTDPATCPESKLTQPKFPSPDCFRWELHRVWGVEGTVKPQFRHVYKKRVHWYDEDSYGPGLAEMYDASGALYRVNISHMFPWYREDGEGSGMSGTNMVLDLRTGIYSMSGMGVAKETGWWPAKSIPKLEFNPEAMTGEGIR